MSSKTEVAGNILAAPLTQIDADPNWNARSGWSKGGDAEHTYAELLASIKEKGQQDPCDVIKVGGRFKLVAGFRRHAAVTEAGIKTLLIRPRDYDMAEARLRNLTENSEKDALRGSDTNWAIGQYLSELSGERPS